MEYKYRDGDEIITLTPSTNEVVVTFSEPTAILNKIPAIQIIQRKSYKNGAPFCDYYAATKSDVTFFSHRLIPVMVDDQKHKRHFLPDQLYIILGSEHQDNIQIDESNMKLIINHEIVLDVATLWNDREFEVWVPMDFSIFEFQKLIEKELGEHTTNLIQIALDAFD
jgi:hypothetical protein